MVRPTFADPSPPPLPTLKSNPISDYARETDDRALAETFRISDLSECGRILCVVGTVISNGQVLAAVMWNPSMGNEAGIPLGRLSGESGSTANSVFFDPRADVLISTQGLQHALQTHSSENEEYRRGLRLIAEREKDKIRAR